MNQETDNSHERRPSFLSVETDKSDSLLENNPLTHRQAFKKVSSNEEHQIDDDDEHSVQVNIPPSVSSIATPKKTMRQKVSAKIPKVPQIRKTLKAAIALGIALVFVFDMRIRRAVGDSVLLHAIVTIFFFPVRTIGIQFEAIVMGVMGGLIAAAWSFLGCFLASLARNPADPNPVQAGASAVLAVFLFIGAFVLNLVRIKVPKANFGCVIACIMLSFALTYSAGYYAFTPSIVWLFLRPVATAGAVCLGVNLFIWPDDSVSNFINVTKNTLVGYNEFFKEHTEAFLSSASTSKKATLPSLKARLQSGVLMMIECKRAVKREIIYSRISDVDCSTLTHLITNMRAPLHGVGLSLILRNEYENKETNNLFFKKFNDPVIVEAFSSSVMELTPISKELSDMCYNAVAQIADRLTRLHYHPRTNLNSFLWPFPRLWISKSRKNTVEEKQHIVTSSDLAKVLARFDELSKSDEVFRKFLDMKSVDIPRNGPLYLIFLYIHNMKKHASNVITLLETMETIEAERKKPRFWMPHQTLKRWIMSGEDIGDNMGAQETQFDVQNGGNDLVRISTRLDEGSESNVDHYFETNPDPKRSSKLGDPDVSSPVTLSQKIFYRLYVIGRWFTKTDSVFALKAAIGVVMLAIPAYRPEDHAWFMDWRGQWAMITLVLWMFPMTGAFIIGLVYRVAGSVIGSVLGIVVWEICRGNPYGLAVLCFFVYIPFYYIFFFIPKYRVIALMSKVTMTLVVAYEYNYVVEDVPNHDEIYTVAGKRLLLVIIGIAASGVIVAVPYVSTGRIHLRKRIGNTLRDIGKCFGILSAAATSTTERRVSPTILKAFEDLALALRRQVAEEHTLLDLTRYEPPLRGYFPYSSYTTLVEKIDNMTDLVANMGYALSEVRPEWRAHIASILMRERKEYLSSILTTLKLMSSTLAAKTSLPPYMVAPIESRQRFVNLLEKKIMFDKSDIADPSFPCYSAYLMNSVVFVEELQIVLGVTEDLVGVEDPEYWLLTRA